MTKYIALTSIKGGVGKTTTAINLGQAISDYGHSVVVVDANKQNPHLSLYLGATKVKNTIGDALQGIKNITDCACRHPSGLIIIPASTNVDNLNIDYSRLQEILLELVGTANVVILDTSESLGKEFVQAINASDELLMITTPDVPAVTDALKTIKIAKDHGAKILGVVLNKVRGNTLELTKKEVEAMLQTKVIETIPYDENHAKAQHLKNPLFYYNPQSAASQSYKSLAAKLLGKQYISTLQKKGNLFENVLKQVGLKK
ncbi:AAA family ATPase [Candidatus Woesearchaeota archaeon]|nr:AAA family ATPase [Candidatus Woesearchaeota archaeon]